MISDIIIKAVLMVSAVAVFAVGKYYFHLKDDNPIEEMAEQVIKQETDYDIDLTPQTPEVNSVKL